MKTTKTTSRTRYRSGNHSHVCFGSGSGSGYPVHFFMDDSGYWFCQCGPALGAADTLGPALR